MKILKNKQFIRFIAILLLMLNMTAPIVSAHDAGYLQVLIDPVNLKYTSNVVTDKPGFSREGAHMEGKTGDFYDLKNKKNKPLKGMELDEKTLSKFIEEEVIGLEEDDKKLKNNSKDDGYIFTFPSKEEGFFGNKNNATSADIDRAFEIGGTLVNNLNSILTTVNNGNKFTDVKHLSNTSIYIRPSDGDTAIIPSKNGIDYYITYATEQGKSKKTQEEVTKAIKNGILKDSLFTYYPKSDEKGNLYAYVYEVDKTTNIIKNMKQFIWAMPKGYIPITGNQKDAIIPNSYKYLNGFNPKDTAWLTIHQLSYQGNFNYINHDLMSAKSGTESEVGLLEGMVYQFVTTIFYGITSILGLYDIEELVFNEGFRGTALFNDGMMNQDWWNVVLRYHMIFQVIAWTLLIGAIIKILTQVHFSTINPSLRISIMETIQKLFVVGFLLVSIIPIVQLMATMNSSIVDIFSTQVDWSSSGRIANHSNILAGLFIEVIYLVISIYVNFVYIMRSIMIAILIASGPFFVVTMAYSIKGKGLFDSWFKELVANIFLQGFHAFSFAFILNVQGGSRGIEELVVAASLIPLTEFFRTMIFGQSGSFAISQGNNLTKQTAKFTTKGAEAFSSSAKNGDSNYNNNNNNDSNGIDSTTLSTKLNSDKLRENVSKSTTTAGKAGSLAVAGAKKTLQAGFNVGLATAKTGAGLALGDNSLLMDGATDFRNMISPIKENIKGEIKSLQPPTKNYDDNGVLGYRETGTTKQPIRSKQYLQDRGLDLRTYNNNKGKGNNGATLLINDRNKLNTDDLNNLQNMESNWNHPDTDKDMFLKKNGMDNILTNQEGHITSIGYNTSGLKQLGISKIQEKDHFGEKALYEDRLNNNNTPNYTYKPIQTLKQATDNKTEEKAL